MKTTPTLQEQEIEKFFAYATERYNIMLRKQEGKPAPWTEDKILRQYRFCNVFREDDITTRWFKANVRDELFYDPEVVMATIIFRWFNKIETGERLLGPEENRLKLFTGFHPDEIRQRLQGVKPILSAAYMIKTPDGMNKLEGLLWCFERAARVAFSLGQDWLERVGEVTLQQAHSELTKLPYMGDFMAYEVITDLRHTALLQDAPDIMFWANPGPGAARGLDRMCGLELGTLKRGTARDRDTMFFLMRQLLELSGDPSLWRGDFPAWEMREVEHTLCEFDKYERTRLGQGTPKQKYSQGA